jgi:hypothetical protein
MLFLRARPSSVGVPTIKLSFSRLTLLLLLRCCFASLFTSPQLRMELPPKMVTFEASSSPSPASMGRGGEHTVSSDHAFHLLSLFILRNPLALSILATWLDHSAEPVS